MNEKMCKCKACGAELAKSAKSCPHCGAKVKKFPIALIVILAVIVVIAIASASGNDEPKLVDNVTPTQSQTSTKDEKTTFAVGETAELKDVLVKFVGITENDGSKYNKPKDGNVYVLCEFEIANNSKEDLAISSIVSFEGYCDDYACEYSIGALMEKGDKNQLDGSVAAGKKMKGVIGYEIPEDWNELEIQFTPDFWSGRDIIFVATNK